MDNLAWLQQFHLIRPSWLIALIPLAIIIWLSRRAHSQGRSWASIIDKRLLPHLLQGTQVRSKPAPFIRLFLLGSLIIFALAGPAFEKRPQPVFKTQSALVILLDLSRSMDTTDIKPSRLSRAHFKINDILKLRKEGQTALIAYAASAYVIVPLTDDAQTIASQVPALETDIMPSQGSRLDKALEKAQQLFNNAGHARGDILVITDSINDRDIASIKRLAENHFSTSVLAIGTEDGAPIASHTGGFVKDSNGSIVIAKLNTSKMRRAALSGGGRFSLLTADDRDINKLVGSLSLNEKQLGEQQTDAQGNKFKTDIWHEEGPWLLLFILPFAAYAFRKGLIFLLLIVILPLPQPAQAFGWTDLWSNGNQQGAAALEQGNAEQAAQLFNDPEWKAAAQYKAGDFQGAAQGLEQIDTAEANYNRGNALAKANQLDNAIKAYERALQLDPQHEDAKYNKQLLEKQKAKQKEKDKKDQPSQDKDKQGKNDKNQDNKQQQSKQKDANSSDSQDQPSSDKPSESQKPSEDKSSEGKSPEDKAAQDKASKDNQADKEKQQAAKENASDDKKSEAEKQPHKDLSQPKNESDATPDLQQQQTQQWLKKIPDDPGGLLRRKFKYQYSRENQRDEQTPW